MLEFDVHQAELLALSRLRLRSSLTTWKRMNAYGLDTTLMRSRRPRIYSNVEIIWMSGYMGVCIFDNDLLDDRLSNIITCQNDGEHHVFGRYKHRVASWSVYYA